MDKVEELMDTEVSEEVAKEIEGEDTQSDSTTEEKSSSKEETSSRTDTSLKTEEEESEDKSEQKEVEEAVKKESVEEDDTRFDKHPRWKQMQEERDNALEEAKSLRELKTKLDGFEADELGRLKEVGKLLKTNPELAKKVQEVIDGHDFRNAEVKNEITALGQQLQKIEQDRVLEKYDNHVSKLLSDNKVGDELKPIVQELLQSRVISKKLPFEKIGDEFKTILKQIDTANRKVIASHVETRPSGVPASPSGRGKVISQKKESADEKDIISELAEGMKALKE